jgi:two-component system CheB/CheR fusion protein
MRLEGQEVHVAHDGLGALRAPRSYQPDLVLLDLRLREVDGYEVARRLRQLPGLGGVVLVALSVQGGEEERRRSREAGFDHHLVRPVEPEVLQQLLARPAVAAVPVP